MLEPLTPREADRLAELFATGQLHGRDKVRLAIYTAAEQPAVARARIATLTAQARAGVGPGRLLAIRAEKEYLQRVLTLADLVY